MQQSEIENIASKYHNFCDAVIVGFRLSVFKHPERRITLRVRCRNTSGNVALISVETKGVRAWNFASLPDEAGEVVSEGIKFHRWGDLWVIDFGDFEISVHSEDWWKHAASYIIAEDVELLEGW